MTLSIQNIEKRLTFARERLKQALNALSVKHDTSAENEYYNANDSLLTVERELAAAKGEQYAVPIDFPIKSADFDPAVGAYAMIKQRCYPSFYGKIHQIGMELTSRSKNRRNRIQFRWASLRIHCGCQAWVTD